MLRSIVRPRRTIGAGRSWGQQPPVQPPSEHQTREEHFSVFDNCKIYLTVGRSVGGPGDGGGRAREGGRRTAPSIGLMWKTLPRIGCVQECRLCRCLPPVGHRSTARTTMGSPRQTDRQRDRPTDRDAQADR